MIELAIFAELKPQVDYLHGLGYNIVIDSTVYLKNSSVFKGRQLQRALNFQLSAL